MLSMLYYILFYTSTLYRNYCTITKSVVYIHQWNRVYVVYNSIIWCYVSCQWHIIFCFTLYVVLFRNYYAIMTILLSTLCTAALHINNAIVIHYALSKLHFSAYIFFRIFWKCILYHNVPYFLLMFYFFLKVNHIPLQCGSISIMCSLLHYVSLL